MESKYSYICVGYKFKSKCGYDLEVVEVFSPSAIKVSDNLGRSKVLSGTAISTKQFKWTYIDGSFCDNIGSRKPRVTVGDIFNSRYYGEFEIISQESKFYTVRFLNSGFVKNCCTTKNILIGNICDNSAERYHKARQDFAVGTVFENKSGQKLVVMEYINSANVICKWEDSGYINTYSTASLKKPANLVCKEVITIESSGFYVYYVHHEGKVVYVGRGKGKRYLHANSGTSSCKELNRLHFLGVKFVVTIEEEGLSYEEAKRLEKIHMNKYTELFNSVIYVED